MALSNDKKPKIIPVCFGDVCPVSEYESLETVWGCDPNTRVKVADLLDKPITIYAGAFARIKYTDKKTNEKKETTKFVVSLADSEKKFIVMHDSKTLFDQLEALAEKVDKGTPVSTTIVTRVGRSGRPYYRFE